MHLSFADKCDLGLVQSLVRMLQAKRLPERVFMLHRMLTIFLIGVTLLGSSICCCTMKVDGAESESPACCCAKDNASNHSRGNSDGDGEHQCPCRENRVAGARLDDNLIVQSSASSKWMTEFSGISPQALICRADSLPPQHESLLLGRCSPTRAGKALLIAHGVSRC